MKKTWFAPVVLIVGLSSAVYAQEFQKDIGQDLGNLKYLHFNNFDPMSLENLELKIVDDETGKKIEPDQSWLKKREDRWIQAFEKVVIMLPESFFDKIGKTSWDFFINQNDWSTAYAVGVGGIVNLLPSSVRPDWMTWEPFPLNGYSQEEMMFVALHELGHFRDSSVSEREDQPTLYGRHGGPTEDFAETFALYVLWPEYLKNNFPLHYEMIKAFLVREYTSTHTMPDSVISRLTVKGHVANSH